MELAKAQVIKWWPVVISLGVIALLLGAILWTIMPHPEKVMPPGYFNVAVAEFTVLDANGKAVKSRDGAYLADYLSRRVQSQFEEINLKDDTEYTVWDSKQTGKVEGSTTVDIRQADR